MFDKLKARFDADDRAVSPVIGVILMVAITVILAAVIASMTLGLGDSAQTAPTAKFNFEQSGNNVVVTHQSGATLTEENSGNITVSYTNGSPASTGPTTSLSSGISAGDEVASITADSGTEVKIIWNSPDGGTSTTLQTYEVQ